VEGGFTVWMRWKSLTYFVLQAECTEKYLQYKNRPKDDSGTVFECVYTPCLKKNPDPCDFLA